MKNFSLFIFKVTKLLLLLYLKNHQNFKGLMNKEHSFTDNYTLRERIEAMPEDNVLFRSDKKFENVSPFI